MTEPRWLTLARADFGVRETPGVANNPVLMKRFASITKLLGIAYNADSVPWCGAIMAWWMKQCNVATPAIAVRASSWATWGMPLVRPVPGAVLVFTRQGGGHVTLYLGEDATHYYCLGGNQSDAITIARLEKSRKPAIRWPKGEPLTGKPVMMAAGGVPVGGSEA
jgi:uncharacterized protein (TIGR02594 family)